MTRRIIVLGLALVASNAAADWSPAWTNGSIWAYGAMRSDLRNAVAERSIWATGSAPAPTNSIWLSWAWVNQIDVKLQSLAVKFCNLTLTNAAGHFAGTNDLPMLTWTGLLAQAGVTNDFGAPGFRRSGTNSAFWPRRYDMEQRRAAVRAMKWTRMRRGYQDTTTTTGLLWYGSAAAPKTQAWAVVQAAASSNYQEVAWSWGERWAKRHTEMEQTSTQRKAYVRREATWHGATGSAYSDGVQPAWTNWMRTFDVYLRAGDYYPEGYDADPLETRYFGDDEDSDMLPSYAAWTNAAYNAHVWHRSIPASSGTVWRGYWIGDTNGAIPTAWSTATPTATDEKVAHGYQFEDASAPSWRMTLTFSPSFDYFLIVRWTPRYP